MKKAFAFCLPNHDDRKICLKDFRGKWLILYFYPKDNTSGCSREALDFTEHVKAFAALNAVIAGVSPDSTASHRKFIEKKSLGIELLSDEEKGIIKKYGAFGLKKMYGREFEGVIRSTFIIDPSGNIIKSYTGVRVKGHVQKVLSDLKSLQNH